MWKVMGLNVTDMSNKEMDKNSYRNVRKKKMAVCLWVHVPNVCN